MNIKVVKDVLKESNELARENRTLLKSKRIFFVNLMSSPGSGKTTILKKTIPLLQSQGVRCAVIEGDITTTLDSEQLQPLGVQVVQANTAPFGGDCHIGPHLVRAALDMLNLDEIDILFVENVGNLVCPAEFDLGEDRKVVILSLPEGDDKPLKYPLMFRVCHLCLVNKMDLAPHLDVELGSVKANIQSVNGNLGVMPVSAKTGEGVSDWVEWLLEQRKAEGAVG